MAITEKIPTYETRKIQTGYIIKKSYGCGCIYIFLYKDDDWLCINKCDFHK